MKQKKVLIWLVLLSLLTGCGSVDSSMEETDSVSPETVPETEVQSHLDAQDFGGISFTVLNREKSPQYNAHPNPELDAPELNGETLNDAVFERNAMLQEKYNIKLVSITHASHDESAATLETAIAAGDTTNDASFLSPSVSMRLALNGSLYRIADIPSLQTDEAWWMDNVMYNTSMGGNSYFIVGDANIGAMNAAGIIYFNKQMHTDYALPNLYAMADEGKWTLDTMFSLSESVTTDADGNGILDQHDIYGTVTSNFAWQPLFYGSGQLLISKNEDDHPYLDIGSEPNYDVLTGIIGFLASDTAVFNVTQCAAVTENLGQFIANMFKNDQGLFFTEVMYGVPELRDMENDFGLLPLPKATENQQNYSTYLHPDNATAVVVPISNTELDRTGVLLEDMAFYSWQKIRPAFYDVMLKSKFARDNDSARMLDIILSEYTIDLGLIMKKSGINIDKLVKNAIAEGNTDIQSVIAANEASYNAILNEAAEILS